MRMVLVIPRNRMTKDIASRLFYIYIFNIENIYFNTYIIIYSRIECKCILHMQIYDL